MTMTALMILSIGAVSLAQSNVNPKPNRPVKPKVEQMLKDLKLTDEQYEAMRLLKVHYVNERSKFARMDTAKSHAKMRDLRQREHRQMMAILTPEQREEAMRLRKARNAQRLDAVERSAPKTAK